MNNKIVLRAVSAAVSLAMTVSAVDAFAKTGGYDAAGDAESLMSISGLRPLVENNLMDCEKADISSYDNSLSLISYELTTPEMYKSVADAQPEGAEKTEQLSEEQKAMLMLIRKSVKKASPVLGKKSKSETPTAVEVYTSGGELKNVPAPQEGKVVESNPGEFAIQTYGWGHGVGMSQNGANFYASYAGWTYQDILFHYYPGTVLMNTGTADQDMLTIEHVPAGDTLDVIAGIVYHEMGSSMAPEAMKAQAVAAYTFLKYNNDDSFDMRMKPNPPENVVEACREVLGEALYYDGDYALTVVTASSGGCSANCGEIFCQDLPYLRSVPGDYDAAYDPHYGTVTYMDAATMRSKIESNYGITLSDDPSNWIQPTYSPTSGYINDVCIDGQIHVQGYAFSVAMGFKSCKFSVQYTDYVKDDDDGEAKTKKTEIPNLNNTSPSDDPEKTHGTVIERQTEPPTETTTTQPATEAATETVQETTQRITTTAAATTAAVTEPPVTTASSTESTAEATTETTEPASDTDIQ